MIGIFLHFLPSTFEHLVSGSSTVSLSLLVSQGTPYNNIEEKRKGQRHKDRTQDSKVVERDSWKEET